jgi:hypothetical protein
LNFSFSFSGSISMAHSGSAVPSINIGWPPEMSCVAANHGKEGGPVWRAALAVVGGAMWVGVAAQLAPAGGGGHCS